MNRVGGTESFRIEENGCETRSNDKAIFPQHVQGDEDMNPVVRSNLVLATGLLLSAASGALVLSGEKSTAGVLGLGAMITLVGLVLAWAARRPQRSVAMYQGEPERRAQLLAAGVPEPFLRVLERDPAKDTLRAEFGDTKWMGAKFTDPRLPEGFTALSIFKVGGAWLLALSRGEERSFIRFSAEDGGTDAYGDSFEAALADILIELYEAETPADQLVRWAHELGFSRGRELLAALEEADRSTFEKDANWRATRLRQLLR